MEIIFIVSLLASTFLAAFSLLRERGETLIFRMASLIFALSVLAMFNMNWLLGIAVRDWTWVMIFMGIFTVAFYFQRVNILLEVREFFSRNMRINILSLSIIVVALIFAYSYFHWDLSVPRYAISDSGTHFLYMHDTSENGKMSLFGKNLIEESSGDATVAPKHNETYFPGSTAVFALMDHLVKPTNHATTLQIFNVFIYAILAGYFILLMRSRKLVSGHIATLFLAAIVLLGTFFNLIVASHSTQLLGLLFLVGFVDTYESYVRRREHFVVPAIFLGALITTYFFWLPVAFLFIGIRFFISRINRKMFLAEFLRTVIAVVAGFIFCSGYILIMFKLNMFQYAASDGGVVFQDKMLADTLIILPIAVIQLGYLFNKKQRSNRDDFATAFFGSTAIFALIIAVFYKSGFLVSHYTAMKSLYLAVPIAWVLAVIFLERNMQKIKIIGRAVIGREWGRIAVSKFILIVAVVLYVFFFGVAKLYDVDWKIFPLIKNNAEYVFANEADPILSKSQMMLLDKIKIKHADILQDGKIFVTGPKKNPLWVFAYSGIWPRTNSLVSEGAPQYGLNSELNFSYSSANDYANWLKQDKIHWLVYFNAERSEKYEGNIFNFDDYDKIETEGDNFLLRLKHDARPRYVYAQVSSEKSEKIALPVRFSFVSIEDSLTGVLLKPWVRTKKNIKNDILLELYEGDCSDDLGQKIVTIDIAKEKIVYNNNVQVYFEHEIKNVRDKTWCVQMSAPDEKTSKSMGIWRLVDGSFEMWPIYIMPSI